MSFIWKLLLLAVIVFIIVKRAGIVALFAKRKYAKGDYFGSLKIFNIAAKVGNLGTGDMILYGYNCLRCGETKAAGKVLSDAYMKTKPNTADRYRIMSIQALVNWKEDDIDAAIEKLEEVYDDNYRTTVIYQNLGIMYNLKGDGEKAVEFNEEAYDYDSDDNIITDNLAEAYAINGEYDKAKETYEELLERDPEPRFPEAYYGYGQLLIKMGEKERGIELIKKSLGKPFSFLSIRTKEDVEQMLSEYEEETTET